MDNGNNVFTIRAGDGGIVKFETVRGVKSTVDVAKDYAKQGYPDRYVVFSESIISDDGTEEQGVYMSLILRPSLFPSQAALLGAMSATALLTALDDHTDKRLGIGWVSDVYCEGTKIGTVGIEGKLDNHTTYEYIIVTFAVKLADKHFPERLDDVIKQVFVDDNDSLAVIIARNVLDKFFKLYVNFKTSRKFMDIYASRFILRGTVVKYNDGTKRRSCKVYGVDKKTGALLLEVNKNGIPEPVFSPNLVQIPKRIRLK